MSATDQDDQAAVAAAVAAGDTYDLIRRRLADQASELERHTSELNADREHEFGGSGLEVNARIRVRTEHNCVPRDIVRVGNHLLFGYNVYLGLKRETVVSDVFAAYRLVEVDGTLAIEPATDFSALSEPRFVEDFEELYTYYQHAALLRMQVNGNRLLVSFKTGETVTDLRVFRWELTPAGPVYVDDRGERELPRPATQDFEWTVCGRDDQVQGRFPHVSIADRVFVETINGSLTIKVENNTEAGFGIYSEPVDEPNQSLDDGEIAWAQVGSLMLLRVRPYREDASRYLVFNPMLAQVRRVDAIGIACQSLPEDHGIVFPGGCYLSNGELRQFETNVSDHRFSRRIRSPNGEDVLFVFYEAEAGHYGLYAYNLIRKTLHTPIEAHGYSLFGDGRLVVFRADSAEPTRHHPMQIWTTGFYDDEHAPVIAAGDSELGKVGNQELVRGISELFSIAAAARAEDVSAAAFDDLIRRAQRLADNYYWLSSGRFERLSADVLGILETSEQALEEFEKVASIRQHALDALVETEGEQRRLLHRASSEELDDARAHTDMLAALRRQRGHLLSLMETRYIDGERVDALIAEIVAAFDRQAERTVDFLLTDNALAPYRQRNADIGRGLGEVQSMREVGPLIDELDEIGEGLDLLTEVLGGLQVDDASKRTAILEHISELYGAFNTTRAKARLRAKEIGAAESMAEFGAQFTLLSQSIASALGLVDSVDACDDALARLSMQLEDLESRFGDYDECLSDIVAKQEELFDAFETRKQALLDAQQRRAQTLMSAGERILLGVGRRTARLADLDALNTFFSSDPQVLKLREIVSSLRDLGDPIKADDLDARLRAARDGAVRTLRDQRDIFEGGGQVIRLGQHRFSVNDQPLDLTIIERDGALYSHLTGTSYLEPLVDERLNELAPYWSQALASESATVYRAEYLAVRIMRAAESGSDELSRVRLEQALLSEVGVLPLVQSYAASRYRDGYERGVHDVDAAALIEAVVPLMDSAGLQRFTPDARALAVLFWAYLRDESRQQRWLAQARAAAVVERLFGHGAPLASLAQSVARAMVPFGEHLVAQHADLADRLLPRASSGLAEAMGPAATYLVRELAEPIFEPVLSASAARLGRDLLAALAAHGGDAQLRDTVQALGSEPTDYAATLVQWLDGYLDNTRDAEDTENASDDVASASAGSSGSPLGRARFVTEAAVALVVAERFPRREQSQELTVEVDGLLGQHPTIQTGRLVFSLDTFLARLDHHINVVAPTFNRYLARRHEVAEHLRDELNLAALKPRPLASFVRNQLLDQVYLPIIGDNLAKQMGTVGEEKRTDLMGLLLLISPPGYGKTTLMEYVADRLGLVFLKVNGPALGHQVVSLDPEQAPDATAAQELVKLNLGLELGNNVMLYLDDIQHTNPEFLQKFISLCDGTRRIEGVWRGQSKTYDLRGRRFCVVMAGNPYTESGQQFRIPDMLANRADVYNLGDVLSGRDEVFAASYIENSLTSNPVLAPLATRAMEDVYRFMRMARGESVADSEFEHSYSGAESREIVAVLQKLVVVQEVLLKVNLAYIRSAATADAYRIEPPFLLQGSYRNMNKLAEKVVAMMSDQELDDLIDDHYASEAQLLTGSAEQNLLKLAELRGRQTPTQAARWQELLADFRRLKNMGGEDADVGARIASQLSVVTERLSGIAEAVSSAGGSGRDPDAAAELASSPVGAVVDHLGALVAAVRDAELRIVNQPSLVVEEAIRVMADTVETTFLPAVAAMDRKIDLDLGILRRVNTLQDDLDGLKRLIVDLKEERHERRERLSRPNSTPDAG